jgi:hypothetical protein
VYGPAASMQLGETALMKAAYNGHLEAVHQLIARGAQPDRVGKVCVSCEIVRQGVWVRSAWCRLRRSVSGVPWAVDLNLPLLQATFSADACALHCLLLATFRGRCGNAEGVLQGQKSVAAGANRGPG